jgi:hypothetical protein
MLRESLGACSQVEVAKKIGVSPQFLSDVLNEKRGPGDRILEFLGIEKVVTYRKRKVNGRVD